MHCEFSHQNDLISETFGTQKPAEFVNYAKVFFPEVTFYSSLILIGALARYLFAFFPPFFLQWTRNSKKSAISKSDILFNKRVCNVELFFTI